MKPDRPAGRPGPVPRFTREYVLEKALEVIEGAPPEEFSMRRLGEALGVRSMTLYGYVENKNDIIESVTRLALDRFDIHCAQALNSLRTEIDSRL